MRKQPMLRAESGVKPRVLGFVNHTHTATAQFFDDAVVRNRLSDFQETPSGCVS